VDESNSITENGGVA